MTVDFLVYHGLLVKNASFIKVYGSKCAISLTILNLRSAYSHKIIYIIHFT